MYEPVHDSLPGTHGWPAIALAQVIPQHQLQLALSHVCPQLVVRQEATKVGSLHREQTVMLSCLRFWSGNRHLTRVIGRP